MDYPIKPLFFDGNYCVIEVMSGFAVCETARLGDYDSHQDELYFYGYTFRGLKNKKENSVSKRVTGALKDAVRKCQELHRIDINISTRMRVDGYEACSVSLM